MKNLKKATGIFSILLLSLNSFAAEFNVLDFGAKADGSNLDTKHIQQAIDEAGIRGGVVIFPAGTYLSGTIYLKSNVTLRLQKGATLLGSTDLAHYPENLPDYTFFRKGVIKRALIYAEKLENIAIEGEGVIDGQGYAFSEPEDENISSYSVRPYVIWMIRCRNVRVEGIRLQNSALWMQHYLGCEKVYIRGIEVYNHSNKNNDMMDIDGCRDVIISDCRGDTDDDGITLKSTHEMPNENISITNCIISSHCNAIKCGTESNAGFKNITISNCIIRPSEDREVIYGKPDGISGISLEVVDGAEMNGVNISNIVMEGPAVPLFIRLGNRARKFDQDQPTPPVGSMKNIMVSNVTAFGASEIGSSITGITGHRIENVTFENIRVYYSGGGTEEDAEKLIEEKERSYPEATMFGKLPAYGMFIRHVRHVKMINVEFHLENKDMRPAVALEDVHFGRFENIIADLSAQSPFFVAGSSSDISIKNPGSPDRARSVISLLNENMKSIRLTDVRKTGFDKFFEAPKVFDPTHITIGNVYD
jgi:polygalacturonase